MPRVTPVSPAEKEVGARLRELRKSQLLTGTAFALKHGIASGNLAKYENGWVPLPWSVGKAICARENISQRWLATGKLPRAPWFWFDPDKESQIPQRAHFSSAYRDFLAPSMDAVEQEFRKQTGGKVTRKKEYNPGFLGWSDGGVGLRITQLLLHQFLVESWYKALPEKERSDMLRHLEMALEDYLKHQKNILPGVDLPLEMTRMTHSFYAGSQDAAQKRDLTEATELTTAIAVICQSLSAQQLGQISQDLNKSVALSEQAKVFWVRVLGPWLLAKLEIDEFAKLPVEQKVAAHTAKVHRKRASPDASKQAG